MTLQKVEKDEKTIGNELPTGDDASKTNKCVIFANPSFDLESAHSATNTSRCYEELFWTNSIP